MLNLSTVLTGTQAAFFSLKPTAAELCGLAAMTPLPTTLSTTPRTDLCYFCLLMLSSAPALLAGLTEVDELCVALGCRFALDIFTIGQARNIPHLNLTHCDLNQVLSPGSETRINGSAISDMMVEQTTPCQLERCSHSKLRVLASDWCGLTVAIGRHSALHHSHSNRFVTLLIQPTPHLYFCLCSPLVAALPVPLLTQEGRGATLEQVHCYSSRWVVQLGASLFPLFTPRVPITSCSQHLTFTLFAFVALLDLRWRINRL